MVSTDAQMSVHTQYSIDIMNQPSKALSHGGRRPNNLSIKMIRKKRLKKIFEELCVLDRKHKASKVLKKPGLRSAKGCI